LVQMHSRCVCSSAFTSALLRSAYMGNSDRWSAQRALLLVVRRFPRGAPMGAVRQRPVAQVGSHGTEQSKLRQSCCMRLSSTALAPATKIYSNALCVHSTSIWGMFLWLQTGVSLDRPLARRRPIPLPSLPALPVARYGDCTLEVAPRNSWRLEHLVVLRRATVSHSQRSRGRKFENSQSALWLFGSLLIFALLHGQLRPLACTKASAACPSSFSMRRC